MFVRRRILALIVLAAVAATSWTYAQRGSNSRPLLIEDVLPAKDCVAFFSFEGIAAHEDEWEKTAFYESIVDSGLLESVTDYARDVLAAQGVEDSGAEKAISDVVEHIRDNGVGIAVYPNSFDLEEPPEFALAISDGQAFVSKFQAILELEPIAEEVDVEEVEGRYILEIDGSEVTAWLRDDTLLVTGPPRLADAIDERIDQSDGPIRGHDLYRGDRALCRAYLDVAHIFELIDEGVGAHPKTGVRVSEILEAAGVSGLQGVTFHQSINGAAIDDLTEVLIDPNNRGIFDELTAKPLKLGDMPPLPENVAAFSFTRCDLLNVFDEVLDRMKTVEGKIGKEGEVEEGLLEAEADLGFPPRDVLAGFGDVFGLYDQSDAGMLAPPIVAVASVRDRAKIVEVAQRIIELADLESSEGINVDFADEGTHDRVTISTNSPISVSLGVSDKWAVAAMTPSYFTDFFARVDENETGWQPDAELLARRPELNSEFNAATFVDTSSTWKSGISFLPMAFGFVGQATGQAVPLPRLPRTRNITGPMFPNVSVTVATETGYEVRSSASAPPLPTTVSSGALSNPAVLLFGVGLTLPAVQGAREAARRTQSTNNLKQLGLAMHNYHDVYRTFPNGTIVDSSDEVDARLSWMAAITPFVEMVPVYNELDREAAWNDSANLDAVSGAEANVFQNPSTPLPIDDSGVPVSTYAGCAGVGKGVADLPKHTKKTGVFGYNRETRMRDILDGTSNTIMIGEINKDLRPWSAGGKGSIRGFTAKPYLNGPDGFGGNHVSATNFLYCDGRVKALPNDIDPDIAEALMTVRGGEIIDEF